MLNQDSVLPTVACINIYLSLLFVKLSLEIIILVFLHSIP